MIRRRFSTIVQKITNTDPLKYVPPHTIATPDDAARVEEFIYSKKRLLILTGAGISTESGVPDYRGQGVGLYETSKRKPMQYQDFIKSELYRRRYWARNFVGWPSFANLRPNPTHQFLATLEHTNPDIFLWLITQNVDFLHFKAGSRKVTELHGSAFSVVCLSCGDVISRDEYQHLLRDANPTYHEGSSAVRPDADVDLSDEQVRGFNMVHCPNCRGGIMKTNVVYFGENVPRHRVEFLFGQVDECDGMIVFGSSLQVYSGYRFAQRAFEQKKPICIVNIGATRADSLASLRIDNTRCADLLMNVREIRSGMSSSRSNS